MTSLGHDVRLYEQGNGWSKENLLTDPQGDASVAEFSATYPELKITGYSAAHELATEYWKGQLASAQIVILHEWNSPALANLLVRLRDQIGYQLLFHDTHHRASSSPEEIAKYSLREFNGILAFGAELRDLYLNKYQVRRAWCLHEAADTSVFRPLRSGPQVDDVVWIGNWGDDERSKEICEFLLQPASQLPRRRFAVWGVRYPQSALEQLSRSGVEYRGYLPNLQAPHAYASARLTLHIPRQQYVHSMAGIPTIRMFEALACGIPLMSAPWRDIEGLFREGDYLTARSSSEMRRAIEHLLDHPGEADDQALRGLETILSRHTCRHRAEQLTSICEELVV